jgi:flavin-dependent dehydrogenase
VEANPCAGEVGVSVAIFDLAIAGAGPAGCAAAITAAAAGARVLLLERGRYPRQKVCGEFVSPEGLSLLEALDPLLVPELLDSAPRITRARLFFNRRCVEVPIAPPAASVTRFALDDALWRAALRAGVECRDQTAVQSVHENFALDTTASEFRAKSVVVAAGRWSNLRTKRNDIGTNSYIGVKAHYSEAHPPASVDLYFFSGGYCGVQAVSNDRVNVCAVVESEVATSLPEVFSLNPDLRDRSVSWSLVEGPLSTAPLIFGAPEPIDGELLYVGDAAGFIDPFVGDGISLALRSGSLAAQCLAPVWARQATVAQAAQQYGTRYRRELAALFRNAAFLRRMTSMQGALRSTALAAMQIPAVARWVLNSTRASA